MVREFARPPKGLCFLHAANLQNHKDALASSHLRAVATPRPAVGITPAQCHMEQTLVIAGNIYILHGLTGLPFSPGGPRGPLRPGRPGSP